VVKSAEFGIKEFGGFAFVEGDAVVRDLTVLPLEIQWRALG
jgi:hypothetical protein